MPYAFTQKSGEMISRLHFEKPIAESEIASRLSGLNFTTRDKVLKLVRQTPEWARDDVGMYQHLYRNGISREILPNIMERIAGQQISETALSGVRVMKIQ